MTHEQTTMTIKKALAEFVSAKADGMTRRALRNYQEVLDIFAEFLEARGITSVEWGPGATPAAGRKRSATVDQIIGLFDDFNESYLVKTVEAEREFLRSAALTCRDLGRWLQTLGTKPTRRVAEPTRVHA
ncbi:MAG TPA: hypothetical protein PKW35_06120 [Nannocystaceae bacterium]|nr:hypothetical protein [Nannocystaceae bacterium]